MTLLLAILSSAVFGTGVALQQLQANAVPDRYAAHLGLLGRLVRRPLWLLGLGAEIGGFALQVLALRGGALVVVQPIIASSLLFTIGLTALWSDQEVSPRDWLAIMAVVGGLAGFLALSSPSLDSTGRAGATDWGLTIGALVGGLALALLTGLRRTGAARAALLGLAAGLGDAVMAVLTKAFAHSLGNGVGGLLHTWAPYALCTAGIAALLVSQTAYQAGHPTVSLPAIAVTDPIASCAVGVGLFGETLHLQNLRGPMAIAAALVMIGGLARLTRSTSEVVEAGQATGTSADSS